MCLQSEEVDFWRYLDFSILHVKIRKDKTKHQRNALWIMSAFLIFPFLVAFIFQTHVPNLLSGSK